MRKIICLMIAFILSIPLQALPVKDKIQYQNTHSSVFPWMQAEDSVPLPEKVYLHTDRSIYYAGDDIWLKAYLIEASDGLPSGLSNNLHVELISPASQIISNRILRIDSGRGKGDFRLPEDAKTGRYLLRAYTNYMRNFGDHLFFIKEITVINAADEKTDLPGRIKYFENKIQISFFPEGGSLVENVSSIVAFKAENNLGKGCDVNGKIYSSAGDLITTFRSVHLGMGSFFLRPLPGLKYYSIVRGADSIDVQADLPISFSAGVNLGVSVNQEDELLITTKTNPETLQLVSDHDLVLSFSVRRELIKTITFRIKELVSNFLVPSYDLPDGIVMVSLSAPGDLPLSERLVYIRKEDPLNIKIVTNKLIYNRRDPVTLRISLSGDSVTERSANVSLAIADKKLTDNSSEFPRTISSWFLLESDVHGFVENPSYYFDPSNPDRFRDLDLLLRTQGWRDFAWKYGADHFPPEKGFTVSGRLRRNYLNKTIEGGRVSIGVFGKDSSFLINVPLDSLGRFQLSGIDFYGEARLIVSGINDRDRLQGIIILDSLIYLPAEVS
jgi:hypothetical protein